MKVVVAGGTGFIGKHLINSIKCFPDKYELITFNNDYFSNSEKLEKFVSECNVIVHLAAMNRNENGKTIYDTNTLLVDKLIDALINTNSKPQIIFASSTQEDFKNDYGLSKKYSREKFINFSSKLNFNFVGLKIPNVFGPFALPNYNTFIATFCNLVIKGQVPSVIDDKPISLIYVSELIEIILTAIDDKIVNHDYIVPPSYTENVSSILEYILSFKEIYLDKGQIPKLENLFKINLFNTFRSYIDYKTFFPRKFTQKNDLRGSFYEIIKSDSRSQFSLSITEPGMIRGQHYHLRKIERFSVIKGSAVIKIRQIGTSEIIEYHVNGSEPSYVDIPIWFTHNIQNIGSDILYTTFWINEYYNPNDPDTYFENV